MYNMCQNVNDMYNMQGTGWGRSHKNLTGLGVVNLLSLKTGDCSFLDFNDA